MNYEIISTGSKEEWRDVVGYEGLYQVSNMGRVKSLKVNDGTHRHQNTKILKPSINQNGYYILNLSNKSCRVHRLVAQAFISNPNNLPCVNHINGIKTDNRVCNLEFCTSSHNNKEAYRLGLKKGGLKDKYGKNYPRKINIIEMLDSNNNVLETFYGTGEIKRKYGYHHTPITNCCKKKKGFYSAYGYKWRFKDE